LQKSALSLKHKTKILVLVAVTTIVISIPLGFDNVDISERGYFALHVVNVIFGSFLSVIGIFTYLSFRNTRLLMIFSAFLAITIAEGASTINLIYPLFETIYGIHDIITHGLILLMLSFFMIGIFRSD
jgi:hypothetical protein